MQLHFEEPNRTEEKEEIDRATTAENRKRGKTPSAITEPSSSSGTSSVDTASSEERGMAVAACPTQGTADDKEKKHVDRAKMTAQTPEKTEQIPRQDSRRHVEKNNRLGDIPDQMMTDEDATVKKPEVKPGILLSDQMGAASKQFRKMTTTIKDDSKPRKKITTNKGIRTMEKAHGESYERRQ